LKLLILVLDHGFHVCEDRRASWLVLRGGIAEW